MSTQKEPVGDNRENIEGSYTESDDESPRERTVHGQYTEADGDPGPDSAVEGSYTNADKPADTPDGEYTES